jgi:beta-ureidopropionase / N-carbamoyl-L-amino-acid hydrolase
MNRREFELALLGAIGWSAAEVVRAQGPRRINGPRLNEHLRALGEFGQNPQGGVSRIAYTDADRQGREYVMGLMHAAGLDVSIDAAGNLLGRRAGSDPGLPPIVMGSHIDSVPEGGNYDGDVGSLGAIEVAQTLAESRLSTRHPLEVIVFQNEEGGLVGSSAISGALTDQELDLDSRSGKTVRDGIAFIGGDPTKLAAARRKRGDIAAYLELHIEQGGVLDAERIDIGVVEGIVGNTRWDVTVEGFANHAGSTPMNLRQDALLAAARFIEAVNRVVTAQPGRQVGTVGRIQALPGAYNVIPGKVVLGLDLRDLDAAKIDSLYRQIQAEAQRIARETGTTIAFQELSVNAPAPTDGRIRQIIGDSTKELRLTTLLMPSGATHDAQDMARLGPIGMIFVPSANGISHSPREFTTPEDVVNGANVLLNTLLKLDALR